MMILKYNEYCLNEKLLKINKIDYNKNDFSEVYFEELGSSKLVYKEKIFPDINYGDPVKEVHIDIEPKFQKKGYAEKMIESFILSEGGTVYIPKGRILNKNFYKVLDKIKKNKKLELEEYIKYYLIYEKFKKGVVINLFGKVIRKK